MVRPGAFGYNPETAATNTFQRPQDSGNAAAASAQARAEFERLAQALGSEGISVCAVDDSPEPAKPDAVFPNNWLSFHDDGTLVLYPMQSASRRPERRTVASPSPTISTGNTTPRNPLASTPSAAPR